jgi:exonuclease III
MILHRSGKAPFKMQIATFNINNVNKRLANLVGWLREARPTVVCLQELKATDSAWSKHSSPNGTRMSLTLHVERATRS